MADFLFEIGLEEIPARMIAAAQAELQRRVLTMLERERLIALPTTSESFSTPRRLAVRVHNVLLLQEDITEDSLGPATKIAYKDGLPTPAAIAFAKKANVSIEQLRTVSTPKGNYLAASSTRPGKPAIAVIEAELPKEVAAIYWPKNMYWREGRPERFVRPVRWMLGLLDAEPVQIAFGGYTAGDMTYGHRVLCGDEALGIPTPADYEETLERAWVIPDVEKRRHTIRKALDHVCRTAHGMRWREDHALVDKMTHLTEWPSVLLGHFDPAFLTLPEEVLVTVMRDHQNYFAVEDGAGKLAPHFLAVLNTQADESGLATIRHGNERVLRARFNDARFFWDFDQRTSLEERVYLLEKVTFHKDLGSYATKSQQVRELSRKLASIASTRAFAVDTEALDQAARLAKTDLTTELVKEFTELQGEVGGLYARAQGLSQTVADAIYDAYRPISMDAPIARTNEGQLLAIADKADTIASMFALGLEPTGSKDPFALRRAGNGIIKTLAESHVPLTLAEIAAAAGAADSKMLLFLQDRLAFYLREAKQQAYDVVTAVLAAGSDDVKDAVARGEAVSAVRGSDDFAAVSAAFKRIKNILRQAASIDLTQSQNRDLSGTAPTQQALFSKAQEVGREVDTLLHAHHYVAALQVTATLRPQIDAFFDAVMVMDPDPEVRLSRLRLLQSVLQQFSKIADFSEIVTAG